MLVDMGYACIPALFQYRSLQPAGATLSAWNIGCYGAGFDLKKKNPDEQAQGLVQVQTLNPKSTEEAGGKVTFR
jgi:hypothetical protein